MRLNQDRLTYGTDIMSDDLAAGNRRGLDTSLAKAWVVRVFLEMDDDFVPPEELAHRLFPGTDRFCGLGLPPGVLERIYRGNFLRLYGPAPAPLNRERVIVELERLAAALDAQAGGQAAENPARQVAMELSG